MPRPDPYIESIAILNLALPIRSRSANRQIAAIYGVLRSASSTAAFAPRGIAPARNSSSTFFMMAGVADPPNFPLTFTPFQFQGLWLEVTITPAAAPFVFTAYDTAGGGV